MNQLRTMRDLLVHDIQMLYSTETLALEGQALLIEHAHDPELRGAFKRHRVETQQQIVRLEQIMELMEVKPSREVCSAMKGLLTDSEKLMRKETTPEVLDAVLIAAAQKVEHYEIACYGTAVRMTEDLGMTQAARLLAQTLDEEKRTDTLLTELAERRVNVRAELH